MILFWAPWCPQATQTARQIHKMLELNQEKWEKRVKCIYWDVAGDAEAEKRIWDEEGWSKGLITTVRDDSGNAGKGIYQLLEFERMPWLILVDTFGCISYIGDPSNIHLESRINSLFDA